MTFHPYGDSAMLINFEQKIDEAINIRVIALHHALKAAAIPEVLFYIPAYCSLTAGFDPERISYDELREKIEEIVQSFSFDPTGRKSRTLHIPVCYDDTFALDMGEVMRETGLSKKEIIELHTSAEFRVYMLGFIPGFPYLGKLPKPLHCSRKSSPRLKVPANSVGIAGAQTGIYPSEAPGGWKIIGKTPLPMNTFNDNKKHPFMCRAGDRIKFRPIPLVTYQYIEDAITSENFNLDWIYE